jgi:tRNA A37 threonylcarbamoyladenosine biosynthesis protein TsaE
VFVEWPEAAAGALPPVRVAVRLLHEGRAHRLLVVEAAEKALLERIFGGVDPRV